ncbi:DUF433 domain-containing protein [Tautonia plasticadhaerens]|uniref:DUF433 domain-containing protein n=1 Tax=Tautonia plasticadhaerens TaxID=2527974 RepID=A0A518H2K0_9BACT|nr:DUF433 domain-containing protein [Tautonia plasticadhaerens]QDV35037.1 hypothetical protein ElP_29360 [Tautonia plasticadhaerens]
MQLPEFLHEQDGEVRLAGHRISLSHLLVFYREGYSAEMLREQFPTLPMALIHKALGYYWEHQGVLDDESARVQDRLEAARASRGRLDLAALRARLVERSANPASD